MESSKVVALRSCLLLCGAMLPAQATLLVGPGGLAEIRDALAVASPGDHVQVLPGTYAQFDASVGVHLFADVAGTVEVAASAAYLSPGCIFCGLTEGVTRFAPVGGHELHVSGITFKGNVVSHQGASIQHRVEVSGGRVTFADCRFEGGGSSLGNPVLSVANAGVHMQACSVSAAAATNTVHALQAVNAAVTAVDCVMQPSHSSGFAAGGNGLRLVGSRLHGAGLTVSGSFLGAALHAASSEIWISDSTFIAGGACVAGGDLSGAHFDRCVFPPASGACPALDDNSTLLGVERPLAPLGGAPFELRFMANPGTLVAVVAGHALGTQPVPGLLAQPSWLAWPTAVPAGLLLADGNGLATASWSLPTTAVGGALWFQAVAASARPLPTSPVSGGVVR